MKLLPNAWLRLVICPIDTTTIYHFSGYAQLRAAEQPDTHHQSEEKELM